MKKRTSTLYLSVIIAGMLLAGCEDADVTDAAKAGENEVAVKEEVAKRLEQLGLSTDSKPGIYHREEPLPILSELKAKLKEQRDVGTAHLETEELPEEIVHAHKQLLEDLREFYGVDKLPKTEIAPGVNLLAPSSYLEGEKFDKLNNFLSDRFREIWELYSKYGLEDNPQSNWQKKNPSDKELPSIAQVLGYGNSDVSAFTAYPYNYAVVSFYSYTGAYSPVSYLDVTSDYYLDGVFFDGWTSYAYNSSYAELPFGPVEITASCFTINSYHTLIDLTTSDLFPSSDFTCV